MSTLSLYFLGEPRVERGGKRLQFDTRKAIALLAYLATTRAAHSREVLAALFYPESDQYKSRGALRRTLSALKQELGEEWLEADRETIGLRLRRGLRTDLDDFHGYFEQCNLHGHAPNDVCAACIDPLEKAVALYRGDFLAGFTLRDSPGFDDWQFFESETLRRELVTALAKLVCRCSEEGQYDAAIRYARRWLSLEPLDEPGQRQLMRLYAWTGQRPAALRQYRECLRLLDQELGVAPLRETEELYRAIEENRLLAPGRTAADGGRRVTNDEGRRRTKAKRRRTKEAQGSASGRPLAATAALPAVGERSSAAVRPVVPAASPYPFVGRSREMGRLELYRSMPYEGRFVALEGEMGIGKTRLAEEFLARVRSDGGLVIDARCYEGQANLAYGPFVEGLRALDLPARAREWRARISPQALAEAARLLPELDALGPLPPLLPLEGPGGQARFLESLSQLLLALCSEQACSVLFVDDLQWIDDASLDLLTYLVRRLRGRSLFILGAWRKEEVAADSRLRQLLAESERAGTGALISLERLNRPAVAELVQAALPASSGPELADRLYRESEGQPFILVEYLALLSGDQRQAGEWSLPGSVRSVLRSRLARLSETARQLLSTAAVIGRSFDYDTLLEASGRSAEETVTGLEELLSQGIIQEVSGGPNGNAPVLDLTHDKLRALVYEETSLVRRRLLHRRVAESLANYARLHHETERLAARIAGHFQQAGEEREAAEYFRMGGDYARSLYANGEALLHYRSALALGHPDAASLHESIGDLQTLSGEYGGALHSYEMAQLLGDGKRTGEIEGKTAGVHARRGDWALAERHFEAALSALGSSPSSRACAGIYGDWSLVALKSGDPERALGLARQALELAEQAQDRPAVAQAHNILGVLARHLGDTAEAAEHLEQSLSLGDALDDPAIRSAALNNLALVSRDRGHIAEGLRFAQRALAASKTLGDRHREAAVHNNLADLYHAAGQEDEAMAHLRGAVTIYAEIGAESGTWQPEIWKLAEW